MEAAGRALAGPLLLLLALGGSLLLILGEFTTQREITILSALHETEHGGDRHVYALVLPALLAPALAWGAAVGRSRPAALGVGAVAVFAATVLLAIDLPGLKDPGTVATFYSDVAVSVGSSIFFQAAGVLALLGTAWGLIARTRERPRAAPAVAMPSSRRGA